MARPAVINIASEIGNLLKIHYGDRLEQQANLSKVAWELFDRAENITVQGLFYQFPVRFGTQQGIGPRPYRGALPAARTPDDQVAQVYQKFFYGSFDIPGPDMARARTRMDSFVIGLSDKMQNTMDGFRKDLNFQCYLDGTGIYATVTALPGTNTQVTVDRTKYLRVDRAIDLWDDSASQLLEAAITNARRITAITPGSKLVVFNVARNAGIAVGDSLIPETSLAAASTQVGIFLNGLGAIVDDGTNIDTFQNIQRSVKPGWKANIFGNGGNGRDLASVDLQKLYAVPQIASGKPIDFMLASPNGEAQYMALMVNQKRFMSMSADAGFTTITYNDKKFVIDPDCQDEIIYGLNRGSIFRLDLYPAQFDDSDGNVLKWTGQKGDTFDGYVKMYGNLGTSQCNAHGKITDLNVDSAYLVN